MKLSLEDQYILIVDDNPSNSLLIELLLQENGLKYIYKAHSATEAYETLKREPIDAILMDVMMPDIDGIQACKAIRQNKEYDTIPIIMVTAIDDTETFKESFHAGADDFIPKPINDIVLMSRLKSQLEKHQMHQTLIEQSRFSAMDEIISMLAHQWRQPLGVINAIVNNIRTKIELETIDKSNIFTAFDNIEHNLGELSTMINDFKSSFSSNQTKECTNLAYTIEEVLKLNATHITKLGIDIEKEVDETGSYLIAKQSLIQVFSHLLSNCFDSFQRSSVKEPKISITLKQFQTNVTLTISDNGEGIFEKDMPYIFEPYFSTKMEKNGKGLGLYFAKQLADKQLSGSLTITSMQNLTTATVTIKTDQSC